MIPAFGVVMFGWYVPDCDILDVRGHNVRNDKDKILFRQRNVLRWLLPAAGSRECSRLRLISCECNLRFWKRGGVYGCGTCPCDY